MTKTAIAYIRVSTTDQKDHGYSLQDQRARMEQFCQSRQIQLLEVFEEDHNAKTFNRPAFNELLKCAKKKKKLIDYLLFIKWDRFSRVIELAYAMLGQFQRMGIECQATEQWLNYDIPEHKLLLSLYIAQPMVDNERRSINTRNGMRRARLLGRYMATAPIGYKNSRNEDHRALIVPDTTIVQPSNKTKSELIGELFREFSGGAYQQEEIRLKYWRMGLRVTKSRIKPLLTNLVYVGKILVPKCKDGPEQIVQGVHEPLVSEEVFVKVQGVLRSCSRKKPKYSRRSKDFPLRGNLVCSKCGKNITGSFSKGRSGKKFAYYHCIHPCKSRMRTESVNEFVTGVLRKIKPHPEVLALFDQVIQESFGTNNQNLKQELNIIRRQKTELEQKINSLEEKFIEDKI